MTCTCDIYPIFPSFSTLWSRLMLMVKNIGKTQKETLFDSIIDNQSPLINKICWSYAKNLQDYEDMRQDCLINIWRGLDSYQGKCSMSTWIYRVCINSCISSIRYNSRHNSTLNIDEVTPVATQYDSDRIDHINHLHQMLQSLNASDRALIMMWLDGFSYEDMSEAFGLLPNTLSQRVSRIRKKLSLIYEKI